MKENTNNIEHEYQDWDKGILRISLLAGRVNRLKYLWDYVIRKKPIFMEIHFYGKVIKYIDKIRFIIPHL